MTSSIRAATPRVLPHPPCDHHHRARLGTCGYLWYLQRSWPGCSVTTPSALRRLPRSLREHPTVGQYCSGCRCGPWRGRDDDGRAGSAACGWPHRAHQWTRPVPVAVMPPVTRYKYVRRMHHHHPPLILIAPGATLSLRIILNRQRTTFPTAYRVGFYDTHIPHTTHPHSRTTHVT